MAPVGLVLRDAFHTGPTFGKGFGHPPVGGRRFGLFGPKSEDSDKFIRADTDEVMKLKAEAKKQHNYFRTVLELHRQSG